MRRLAYVPTTEFARLSSIEGSPALRTAAFAGACRINILYMVARAGSGHLGTSFSSVDLVSWLFLNEVRRPQGAEGDGDVCFSSKGHDAPAFYAVLTGMGLLDFELIHRLRRLRGLPGHPDISIPFMETNTGSLGMGISKAKGLVLANRILGRSHDVFVLTGDGELQEGQIWEALPTAAHLGMGELTVVVDHNKIQSDTWVESVSDLGDVAAKFRAFGWHTARCDGHDMDSLRITFGELREVRDRPKALIAETLKGKGVSLMEPGAIDPADHLYRFHSGAPSPEVYDRALTELVTRVNETLRRLDADELALEPVEVPVPVSPGNVHRLVTAYGQELVRQAEQHPRLVVLDADLVLDCGLIPFRDRFPERFIECGIAEQDMVSTAGGLALRGLLPVVHSFAAFLSARPNEQIYNNASERTKILYVGSLAGLLPAGPGHTHQSIRDVGALGAIPNLIAIEPCAEEEVAAALDYCVNRAPSSCYLRLVSIPAEVPYALPRDYRLEPGRGVTLMPGTDGVLIGAGPVVLAQAYRAAVLLAERAGVRLQVVNLPWLNHVDADWLADLVSGIPWVFTLDNHYVMGGQGQMIIARLAELDRRPIPRTRRFGLTDFPLGGGNTEVLRAHRLDGESLYEDIAAAMGVRL